MSPMKLLICLACMILPMTVPAQITGSGSANQVPKFTGSTTVGNSAITESSGNVGIGTTSPAYTLHVNGNLGIAAGGNLYLGAGLSHSPYITANWLDNNNTGLIFHSFNQSADVSAITILSTGNVGIGTTSPGAPLSINTTGTANAYEFLASAPPTSSLIPIGGLGAGLRLGWGGDLVGPTMRAVHGGDYNHAGIGFSVWQNAAEAEAVRITNSGNVGIGTTTPGAKLEIAGAVKLTSGSGGSITFADGTTQTTAWTGALCGGDYAESVDVVGGRKEYEPGDVLVISEAEVAKSKDAYSTRVLGIYSTKPGLVGRRSTDPDKLKNQIPMAMTGIVPVRVSAENGPIHRGDLLVTSSTTGYAMRGTDRSRMLGAIIGKALGSLDSGKGIVEAAVALQ